MARERCTQSYAFAILRSASQNNNVKLRDIAASIVTSVTGQPSPPFEDTLTTSHEAVNQARPSRDRPLG
jgi:ANTAR domain